MEIRLAALALALPLAACGQAEANTAPLTLHEAYERLTTADTTPFRDARQCGLLIHLQKQAVFDDYVKWRVTSGGRDMVSFTARLSPAEDGGTRVVVEIPADPKGGEAYDGSQFHPRPALKEPLRPAAEEFVAAALEGRAFDAMNLPYDGESRSVCDVQRAGLQSGRRFAADDIGGTDSAESARIRAAEEQDDEDEAARYGEPTADLAGDGW